jgi:hypothetical protein
MKIYKVLTSGNTGESLQNISEPSYWHEIPYLKIWSKDGSDIPGYLYLSKLETANSNFQMVPSVRK